MERFHRRGARAVAVEESKFTATAGGATTLPAYLRGDVNKNLASSKMYTSISLLVSGRLAADRVALSYCQTNSEANGSWTSYVLRKAESLDSNAMSKPKSSQSCESARPEAAPCCFDAMFTCAPEVARAPIVFKFPSEHETETFSYFQLRFSAW
ncbi:unnamed protein product [Pieris macdunnoughi]|uniref:Uncharacterized protein n=1 Tax=Pieris macdunnoughi TaxID=345717 RepID=A0A821X7M5_9NEOP|nr:unnamed protein product [Pieris macdunnoughi]